MCRRSAPADRAASTITAAQMTQRAQTETQAAYRKPSVSARALSSDSASALWRRAFSTGNSAFFKTNKATHLPSRDGRFPFSTIRPQPRRKTRGLSGLNGTPRPECTHQDSHMTDTLAHADSLPEYPTDSSVRMSLYPVRELLHPKVSMNHQARPPGGSSDRWRERAALQPRPVPGIPGRSSNCSKTAATQ